jgi:hypothetical protein
MRELRKRPSGSVDGLGKAGDFTVRQIDPHAAPPFQAVATAD